MDMLNHLEGSSLHGRDCIIILFSVFVMLSHLGPADKASTVPLRVS